MTVLLKTLDAPLCHAPHHIQFGNGSENKNAELKALLERERVIAQWNEQRTP